LEARGARRCEDGEVQALRHLNLCDAARTEAEARAGRLAEEVMATRRARGELAGDLREAEARMRALQGAGDAPASRRRRRVELLERFRVLGEGHPELTSMVPTVVADRLVVTLPSSELSGAAWDRIAEVLRDTPDARWSVEVRGETWASAGRLAGSACVALVDRGVDASRLRAVGRQGQPSSARWRAILLEEGVDAGSASLARPAPVPSTAPAVPVRAVPGAAPSPSGKGR